MIFFSKHNLTPMNHCVQQSQPQLVISGNWWTIWKPQFTFRTVRTTGPLFSFALQAWLEYCVVEIISHAHTISVLNILFIKQ